MNEDTILDALNFYPTKPGDVFFIPAGTVHAVGAGNLICEIQQSSNSTYRLYDYNRRDKFGNRRELHLRKALDVLDYRKYEPVTLEENEGKLQCKYFEVSLIEIDGTEKIALTDDSFYSLTCIRGSGKLLMAGEMPVSAGDTFFIPATNETIYMEGRLSLILTRV